MNGVFGLGGTDGLGPVITDENEPVFRAEWEKPAFAMFASCFRAGFFGVDAFRHGIEHGPRGVPARRPDGLARPRPGSVRRARHPHSSGPALPGRVTVRSVTPSLSVLFTADRAHAAG